jgi:bacteriocin-like protein
VSEISKEELEQVSGGISSPINGGGSLQPLPVCELPGFPHPYPLPYPGPTYPSPQDPQPPTAYC